MQEPDPNNTGPSGRFARLPDGPFDIVGDTHGEIDPLKELLAHLGYDRQGIHAKGRRLVFIGDLADRGPDSPAVIDLVRGLVESGRAWCLMGNHEMNLVRGARKDGNGWAFERNHDAEKGRYPHSKNATPSERDSARAFFRTLPLTLENETLRLVHACWNAEAIATLKANRGLDDIGACFDEYDRRSERDLIASGLAQAAELEEIAAGPAMEDPKMPMRMLDAVARADERRQMSNPLRVIGSGMERHAKAPFFSSGRWRFVDRVPWWNEYADDVPVVIGHFWRWPVRVDRALMGKDGPDLFDEIGTQDWFGLRRNVYCIDFSVGRRFVERQLGKPVGSTSKLGALRWPERELVFDDGAVHQTA